MPGHVGADLGRQAMSQWACELCGMPPLYYSSVDIFGCPECDVWTENQCRCREQGHECPFMEAPEKPSLYDGKIEDFRRKP